MSSPTLHNSDEDGGSGIDRFVQFFETLNLFIQKAEELLGKTRSWLQRLLDVFQDELPEESKDVNLSLLDRSSQLQDFIEESKGIRDGDLNALMSGEQQFDAQFFDSLNSEIQSFNVQLNDSRSGELHKLRESLIEEGLELPEPSVLAEEIDHREIAEQIEDYFSEEEKEEIREFADELWNELFPPSHTDRFAQWATGSDELEEYQKILLAPANGIESTIVGIWELASHPIESYENLEEFIHLLSGMSYEDFCACMRVLKFMFEESDKETLIAPSISFIVGCLFICGGASKLTKIMKGKKLPAALLKLARPTSSGNRVGDQLLRAKDMPTEMLEEIDYESILEDLQSTTE